MAQHGPDDRDDDDDNHDDNHHHHHHHHVGFTTGHYCLACTNWNNLRCGRPPHAERGEYPIVGENHVASRMGRDVLQPSAGPWQCCWSGSANSHESPPAAILFTRLKTMLSNDIYYMYIYIYYSILFIYYIHMRFICIYIYMHHIF